MLKENLPKCICGRHDYKGGGGYCGGSLTYTNFSCRNCGRNVLELYPWVFFSIEGQDETIMDDYINDVILPLRRVMKEEDTLLTPPQVPDQIDIYVHENGHWEGKWVLIDCRNTQDLPLPIDPIGVEHRAFWKDIVETTKSTEVPNEYYNDRKNNEPWYTFMENGAKITYGPRKRVISIWVERETPFNVSEIAKLAERDGVTFEVKSFNGSYLDHKLTKEASHVLIHAWGKEKFDEYFKVIRENLRNSACEETLSQQEKSIKILEDKEKTVVYVVEQIKYKKDYGCDVSHVVDVCSTEESAKIKCKQFKEETGVHHQYEGWEVLK